VGRFPYQELAYNSSKISHLVLLKLKNVVCGLTAKMSRRNFSKMNCFYSEANKKAKGALTACCASQCFRAKNRSRYALRNNPRTH
jgi:hypothetical protein